MLTLYILHFILGQHPIYVHSGPAGPDCLNLGAAAPPFYRAAALTRRQQACNDHTGRRPPPCYYQAFALLSGSSPHLQAASLQ